MKLETENSCPVTCGKLDAKNRRSGIALIITLTIMALLLILAVAFMTNMRSERQVSLFYRRQVEARQATLAGLHTAIARMSRFYTDAEATKASVATMAGRFYYTNGSGSASVPVPSGTARPSGYVPATNNMLMFSWIMGRVYGGTTTNWADKVNLNGGNFKWPREVNQSGIYLPIANPCVNPTLATGEGWGPDKPAIWASYLRTYGSDDARFAFWIDDESSKINISNAYTKNLSDAALNNATNFTSTDVGFTAADSRLLYAKVVQPDVISKTGKQISSVDLKMLDVGAVSPGYNNYEPDGANKWSDATTLSTIENARNTSTWRPFQSSDEVLSLNNSLTMNDYQAVKSCLTAWSVENDDRAQVFKDTAGYPVARTNVGITIRSQLDATRLYNFLIKTNNLASTSLPGKFFGGVSSSATYGGTSGKYPDISQPFINGGVSQIVANIVSYLSDPTVVAPPGSCPPLCPEISPEWTVASTNLPSGPCGLWKAAYMNEIAVSLCWQPVQLPADPKPKYQLWAALYIELINPYEVAMPRLSITPKEEYQIFFDDPATVTCTAPMALPPSLAGSATTNIVMGFNDAVGAHSYKEPKEGLNHIAWKLGTTQTNIPPITAVAITFPRIRQTMNCAGNKGIIDWSVKTNMTVSTSTPKLDDLKGSLDSPPAAEKFWDAGNPARWSIAKNDPRVRVWYPCVSSANVTIKGKNASVNFTDGDNETQNSSYAKYANQPEYRSNFVIAESGMNSIGELGFIHTGKPWRSLSLQYYGAQTDETGQPGSSARAIADWVLLDLFSVNTPPIYGRVNINNGGWHLGNNAEGAYQRAYPNCPTFEDPPYYPRHPNLLATWNYGLNNFLTVNNYQWSYTSLRSSSYNRHPNTVSAAVDSLNFTYDSASVPLAAALSVIPDYRYRNRLANFILYRYHPLTSARTSFAPLGDPSDTTFIPTRDIWHPYYTVGQICEVPYMNNLFTGDGRQVAYTDADKEDTVRRIINVLTTRGDVFTVHVVGYADGGEARLQAVVERVRNPAATQIMDRNQFRIKQVRWLTE
ncbi:MAG: hypothetical protein WC740_04030 [Verrucomicrobiia bacterium]